MWNPQDIPRRRKAAPADRDAISTDAAERLLGGTPAADADHAAIAALLAAAAGPARPRELRGEREALAAFSRAYRRRSRLAAYRRGPRLGVAVAATLAALLVGGTAYAAGTGRLPDALQRTIEDLLPGGGTSTPTGSSTTGQAAPGSVRTAQTTRPLQTSTSLPSDGPIDLAQQLSLCRLWQAFRDNPGAKPVSADERHALARAAGGENAINDFCERLLNPTPAPTATTAKPGNPDPGGAKPSHPVKPSRT